MSIAEDVYKYGPEGAAFKADPMGYTKEKAGEKLNSLKAQGKEYYNQAKGALPEGLAPETFMDKIVEPLINAVTQFIMENILKEDNIKVATEIIEDIVTNFFKRLDDMKIENPNIKNSIDELRKKIISSISREARKTIAPEEVEMKTFGGKRRKRYTKKRRGSKRRY